MRRKTTTERQRSDDGASTDRTERRSEMNLEKWMMRNKRQRKSETIDNVSAEQTEDQLGCVDLRAE